MIQEGMRIKSKDTNYIDSIFYLAKKMNSDMLFKPESFFQ